MVKSSHDRDDDIFVQFDPTEFNMTEEYLEAAKQRIDEASDSQVREVVQNVLQFHTNDSNFPSAILHWFSEFSRTPDVGQSDELETVLLRAQIRLLVDLILTNSPYPEVRAIVSNKDGPQTPCSTIRSWAIGLSFVVGGSAVNHLFSIRQPPIGIEAMAIQLLPYPLGKAAEQLLPDVGYSLCGVRHSLNPGPFSQKEHLLITSWQMGEPSYASSFSYQVLLSLSSDLMGYGLAGLGRKFLVYPSFCLFRQYLPTLALTNALHGAFGPFRRTYNTSRSRFFMYAFVGMFCYAWFPGYLFERLRIFNWLSWISPSNRGRHRNFFWFTNIYWASHLPINTNRLFNRWGTSYNVSEILDSHALLDQAKYQQYSTASLAPSSLVRYTFYFATYSATISYAIFSHGQTIIAGFRNLVRKTGRVTASTTDVHSKLMRTYKEVANRLLHPVSEIWYAALNVLALTLAVVVTTAWPTSTNVGVVFVAFSVAAAFLVPVGQIYALTGIAINLKGSMDSRQPTFSQLFQAIRFTDVTAPFLTIRYTTLANALPFISDLKLAHYAKLPPWHTFSAQVVATVVSAVHWSSQDVWSWRSLLGFTRCLPDRSHLASDTLLRTTTSILVAPHKSGDAAVRGNHLVAAFSSAIAIASLLIYFSLQSNSIELPWWGNYADLGCEKHACTGLSLTGEEYFGPREGEWHEHHIRPVRLFGIILYNTIHLPEPQPLIDASACLERQNEDRKPEFLCMLDSTLHECRADPFALILGVDR
ncbi:OPT family oligopeptide transporter [Aspergillus foveolatus]|uniref:OPT family oligopeptide transporter n=1 Tax=Aspergillus foveolatus TaxID=210207 RepID=UPI003CCE34DB